jgi:hypothetical protein
MLNNKLGGGRRGRWLLLKVVGVDRLSGKPRSLLVKTDDERWAWQRAEARGISPREVIRLATGTTPRKPDRKGVVYLLRCGGYYKIGKSVNSDRRYGELRIQLPERPVLVHEIRTNDVDYCERHWHRRFASQRANGEWFSLSQDDVTEFTRCERMVVKHAEPLS